MIQHIQCLRMIITMMFRFLMMLLCLLLISFLMRLLITGRLVHLFSAPLSTSARDLSHTTPRLLLDLLPLLFLIMLLLLPVAGVGRLQLTGTSPLLSRQARK